jgi:hypothetical protein
MDTSPSKEHTASYCEAIDTMNIMRLILMPTRKSFVKLNAGDKDMWLSSHEKLTYLDKIRYDSMLYSIVQNRF